MFERRFNEPVREFMHLKGPYVQLIIGKFQNY